MLTPIYSPEEKRERALKALRLNGDTSPDYNPRLLAASSTKRKPTFQIKRSIPTGKLKDASSIQGIRLKEAPSTQGLQREREKALKVLKLVA